MGKDRRAMPAPTSNPTGDQDLHVKVPDTSAVALLLIDVINDLEYPGGDKLLEQALPMGCRLAAFKRTAKAAGIPALYGNDNFGRWQSDLDKLVAHCLHDGVRGQPFVELLLPDADDYFVLKPQHSGFYLKMGQRAPGFSRGDEWPLTAVEQVCYRLWRTRVMSAGKVALGRVHFAQPIDCSARCRGQAASA
jgi:hypothetical protein